MMKYPLKERVKALAALIMDADAPKRLMEENKRLRAWAEDEQRKREDVEDARLRERMFGDALFSLRGCRSTRLPIYAEVEAERDRQIAKGYDAAHDDTHTKGEIAVAAASIAAGMLSLWPWDYPHRPSSIESKKDQMIKAAAMLVAEIERLDRLPTFRNRKPMRCPPHPPIKRTRNQSKISS